MTNAQNTKRALLTSILAMLLCFSMLLGTTFAWFTDEATSTGNNIIAGTLDIALYQVESNKITEIKDSGPLFGEDLLWAPGHNHSVDLKIVNEGNLTLDWKMKMIPAGGAATIAESTTAAELAEVIDVYLIKENIKLPLGTLADILQNNVTIASGEMRKGDAESFTLVMEMKGEEAGNAYQGQSVGSFTIKLFAEQSGRTRVKNINELYSAIENGDTIVIVDDFTTPTNTDALFYAPSGKYIDVDGNGSTITTSGIGTKPGSGDYGYVGFIPADGEGATVRNLKVVGSGFVEVGHHPGTEDDGEEGSTGGTYIIDELVIENLISTLWITEGGKPISTAFTHYGHAVMTDCVMTGTTTLKDGYKPYDAGFVNKTTTTIYGGQYGTIYLSAQAHVTVSDGTVIDTIDSCAITTSNLGKLTICAGAKVGTINLTPPGNYKPALVIEEGAEIGKIVYQDVEYTVAEWLAR